MPDMIDTPVKRSARRGLVPAVLLTLSLVACGGAKKPASKTPELTPEQKVRQAQSLMNAGKFNDALATLQQAIDAEPDNALMRNFKGQMLFIAGRYDEAEAPLRKALELDPYLTDVHNNLGALYDAQGHKSEAEAEYRLALADPAYRSPEKVYLNLGVLYSSQLRDREAVEVLRKAVEIDPEYYQAHFELASVLERLDELNEAVREYKVAEPAYRRDGHYFYRLGLAYFRLGMKQEARENLTRAVSLAPGSPSAAQADDLLEMLE